MVFVCFVLFKVKLINFMDMINNFWELLLYDGLVFVILYLWVVCDGLFWM